MSEIGIGIEAPYEPEQSPLYVYVMGIAAVVAVTFPLWGI